MKAFIIKNIFPPTEQHVEMEDDKGRVKSGLESW
mgnify:FL=1